MSLEHAYEFQTSFLHSQRRILYGPLEIATSLQDNLEKSMHSVCLRAQLVLYKFRLDDISSSGEGWSYAREFLTSRVFGNLYRLSHKFGRPLSRSVGNLRDIHRFAARCTSQRSILRV